MSFLQDIQYHPRHDTIATEVKILSAVLETQQ